MPTAPTSRNCEALLGWLETLATSKPSWIPSGVHPAFSFLGRQVVFQPLGFPNVPPPRRANRFQARTEATPCAELRCVSFSDQSTALCRCTKLLLRQRLLRGFCKALWKDVLILGWWWSRRKSLEDVCATGRVWTPMEGGELGQGSPAEAAYGSCHGGQAGAKAWVLSLNLLVFSLPAEPTAA